MKNITWKDNIEFTNFSFNTKNLQNKTSVILPKSFWTTISIDIDSNINIVETESAISKWLKNNCNHAYIENYSDTIIFGKTQASYVIYFEDKNDALLFKMIASTLHITF